MNIRTFYHALMKLAPGAFLSAISINAYTAYVSTPQISDYSIAFDNGVMYISHPLLVSPCLYGRVEIRDNAPYSTEYAKRMTAAILMAKAMGKAAHFVWNDSTAPTCLLYGVTFDN